MPVKSHPFNELCKYLDSDHQVLLFYSKLRWLSKGIILRRVFALKKELKVLLDMQSKESIVFSLIHIKKLNLKLQGKDISAIMFVDSLPAFIAKI